MHLVFLFWLYAVVFLPFYVKWSYSCHFYCYFSFTEQIQYTIIIFFWRTNIKIFKKCFPEYGKKWMTEGENSWGKKWFRSTITYKNEPFMAIILMTGYLYLICLLLLITLGTQTKKLCKASVTWKFYINWWWFRKKKVLIVILVLQSKKQPPDVFCKKGVLRNFKKFTGKHLWQSLFFNKVAVWGNFLH